MSLYEIGKISVIVDSKLSKEFTVKVGMHQGSVMSTFLFAVVIDFVTELTSEGVLSRLLYVSGSQTFIWNPFNQFKKIMEP